MTHKKRKLHKIDSKYVFDSDADGLSDVVEQQLGTDPYSFDSDMDGIGDFEEVYLYHTDPLNPDTDNDGISDGDEIKMGRNPLGKGVLKDLFIPHEGNDYKPHLVRPKHLIWHGAFAVLIKVMVFATIVALPTTALLTPDVLKQQSIKIIEMTNTIRSNFDLPKVITNEALNTGAVNKADDMAKYSYFAHAGPDGRRLGNWLSDAGYAYSVAGENLAVGFSSPQAVMNAWQKSPTHYANIVDPDYTEIGVGMSNGTYKDRDTTFIAQFFGRPYEKAIVVNTTVTTEPVPEPDLGSVPTSDLNSSTPITIAKESDDNASDMAPIVPVDEPVTVLKPLLDRVKPKIDAVAGVKEETIPIVKKLPLEEPVIVSPENELLTQRGEMVFVVQAPQAERVILFDNNNEIAQAQVSENGDAQIAVTFFEGIHRITVTSVRGDEKVISQQRIITIDQTPPVVDTLTSRLILTQQDGKKVINATVILSPDTIKAEAYYDTYKIPLSRDDSQINVWTGEVVVFDEEEDVFAPIILGSVVAEDLVGNVRMIDIGVENFLPKKSVLTTEYAFFKANQSKYVKPLFGVSNAYYLILIIIMGIAVILNIVIEIRKQHPHIIASSVAFVSLIALLLIF